MFSPSTVVCVCACGWGGGYEVKCRCVSMGRKARGAVLQAVRLSFGGQSVSLASNSPVVYRLADQKAITVSPPPPCIPSTSQVLQVYTTIPGFGHVHWGLSTCPQACVEEVH